MSLVVPAVLPSSRKNLEETLALLAPIPPVSRIQIDVVDGRLAAPASWPYTAPAELAGMAARGEMLPHLDCIQYEIDLMCFDAADAVGAWIALGASRFVVHPEAAPDLAAFFKGLRRRYGGGAEFSQAPLASFGLAVNVAGGLAPLASCAAEIDFIQCMGIARVGRQGEPFDPRALKKVQEIRARYPDIPLQVDGGVTLAHAKEIAVLGVANLVVGSAILRAENPAAAVAALEALQSPYGV